jgi:hypothetical protein
MGGESLGAVASFGGVARSVFYPDLSKPIRRGGAVQLGADAHRPCAYVKDPAWHRDGLGVLDRALCPLNRRIAQVSERREDFNAL